MAPHPGFASGTDPLAAMSELKELVKEAHNLGIEVMIGMHLGCTAEGDDQHPRPLSFRGVDAATYYRNNHDGDHVPPPLGG